MNDILEIAAANQQRAREVIRDTDLEAIWHSVGAEADLVSFFSILNYLARFGASSGSGIPKT